MAINSRAKGVRGEQELARLLREHGYENARRGQQYCGKAGDADIVDALDYVHIECKRVEALNYYNAIAQAEKDRKPAEVSAVISRKNDEDWLVTMTFAQWIWLYKAYKAHMDELATKLGGYEKEEPVVSYMLTPEEVAMLKKSATYDNPKPLCLPKQKGRVDRDIT